MPWIRIGDTVAFDPRTLHPYEDPDADARTVDEVFGFAVRLAAEAASKETDRHVTRGMARHLAGTPERGDRMMSILVSAGIWQPDGTGWTLVNDPNYIHLQAKGEVDRSRIRARDNRNDALTVNARLRDGDECRYCRKVVNWRDRKSLRGGTWEHVNIANQPTLLAEFVVCCFECNREPASRGSLLHAPSKPVYGADTKLFVKERLGAWPTRAEIAERLGMRTSQENAASDQRTEEEHAPKRLRTPSEHAFTGQRPDQVRDVEIEPQEPAQRPENASENATGATTHTSENSPPTRRAEPPDTDLGREGLTDLPASGRVGSVRAGSGRDVPGQDVPGRPARRSRRSKPRPPKETS